MKKYIVYFLIAIGFLFLLHTLIEDIFYNEYKLKYHMRTADSLRIEVDKYKKKYDSLLKQSKLIDDNIIVQESSLSKLKGNTPLPLQPKPRTKKPKDVEEALVIINNLIKE